MTMSLKTKNNEILTLDLGGTNFRAGMYCQKTDQLSIVNRISTPNYRSYAQNYLIKSFLNTVYNLCQPVLSNRTPKVISCAFAGPVDNAGNASASPTIFGDRNFYPINLTYYFKKLWPDAQIIILNDLTAAGYYYLEKKDEDLCIVTVSSGVGNKVFLKGFPLLGPNNRGGEIGHFRIDLSPDAPICDCGERGHIGALSSGRSTIYQANKLFKENPAAFLTSGIGKRLRGEIKHIDNDSIVEFASKGDSWSLSLINKMVHPIAKMLVAIHLGIGIERFIIIGGFALSLGECYIRKLVEAATVYSWNLAGDWDSMVDLGFLDDTTGLIGAGRYASKFLDVPRK